MRVTGNSARIAQRGNDLVTWASKLCNLNHVKISFVSCQLEFNHVL